MRKSFAVSLGAGLVLALSTSPAAANHECLLQAPPAPCVPKPHTEPVENPVSLPDPGGQASQPGGTGGSGDSSSPRRSGGGSVIDSFGSQPVLLGPAYMQPFPVVRLRAIIYRTRTKILRLGISNAPAGVRVEARCRGRRQGCPFATTAQTASGATSFKRLRGRMLKPGAKVQVRVTAPGKIGKFTAFVFKRNRGPARTDACIPPAGQPRRCP